MSASRRPVDSPGMATADATVTPIAPSTDTRMRPAPRSHARHHALRAAGVLLMLALSPRIPGADPGRSMAPTGDLVNETFSGKALPPSWKVDKPQVWSIRDGRLRAVLPDRKQARSFVRIGSQDWKNYAVDLDVCQVRGVDKGFAVRVGNNEGVAIDLRGGDLGDVVMYRNFTRLGKATSPNVRNTWYHLRVVVKGPRYLVFVDQALRIDYLDEGNQRPSGGIALTAYTGGAGECEVLYDNLVVTQLP